MQNWAHELNWIHSTLNSFKAEFNFLPKWALRLSPKYRVFACIFCRIYELPCKDNGKIKLLHLLKFYPWNLKEK